MKTNQITTSNNTLTKTPGTLLIEQFEKNQNHVIDLCYKRVIKTTHEAMNTSHTGNSITSLKIEEIKNDVTSNLKLTLPPQIEEV